MYTPIQIGLPRSFKHSVEYEEFTPSKISRDIVYCYWVLRSRHMLAKDFKYLVLPDGCIDIVFDVSSAPGFTGALIMSSDITATAINLGKSFAYIGIRMQPGAWLKLPITSMGQVVERRSLGEQDLERMHQKLTGNAHLEDRQTLEDLAISLFERSIIGENALIQHLLQRPIATVEDAVQVSGYSRRQVQRLIRERVGYNPHDFLRIIRFQRALTSMKADEYADQSHFIRDFKRITGMTPGEFKATYLF